MMERSPGHGLTTDHSSHDIRLYTSMSGMQSIVSGMK